MAAEQRVEDVIMLDQELPSALPASDDDHAAAAPAATRSGGSSSLPSWALREDVDPPNFDKFVPSPSDSEEEYMSQPVRPVEGRDDPPTATLTQTSDRPSLPDNPAGPNTQQEDGQGGGQENPGKKGPSQDGEPVEGAPSKHTTRSEVTIMMPDKDKLYRHKVIVELEPADHGATDLSGDSGAVGRVLVTGKPGSEEVRIDLKGIIYKASILPLVGTMCVVNIGPTDAKVETLCSDFIRLQEESNFYAADAVVEGNVGEEDVSDEEPVQAAAQAGGDNAAGPSGKVVKKKTSNKNGKQDAFKALMKGTGGVKKKVASKTGAVKAKADGKGKAAAKTPKAGKAGKSKAAGSKKKTAAGKKGGTKAAAKKSKSSKD